ncbi:MAG: copper-translocating P-type ATPase [Bacteroidetes bacterium]|nr:copper-translocating P-type ATPase [Bacteroidota bacterium]
MIESVLTELDGVQNFSANPAEKWLRLELEDNTVLAGVVQKLDAIGYPVHEKSGRFPVMHMTCAACAVSTESMLRYHPGVISATVEAAGHTAFIRWIPEITNPEAMAAALRSIGYDLNLNTDSSDDSESTEHLKKSRLKSLISLTLAIPLAIAGMFFMHHAWAPWIMWLLSTPIVFYSGSSFFIRAWKQIRHRQTGMDTLVALSTGTAYLFSIFNLFFPHLWHKSGIHAHVWFESAGVVIAFVLLGRWLEEKARNKTGAAIQKLMGLQPNETVRIKNNGEYETIPIFRVMKGDLLLARKGEKISADGVVAEGNAWVDESMMTGEPIPAEKSAGSHVLAGTVVHHGNFTYRAAQTGDQTLLAGIIQAVKVAQGSKAPVQKLVDRISMVFVPVVVGIAIVSALVWGMAGGTDGWLYGLHAFVTVLVVACPCALGLATPAALSAGIGKAAESGILVRDAESLERIANIQILALDKTGTLTEGKPQVVRMLPSDPDTPVLNAFFTLMSLSSHPLASAIASQLLNCSKRDDLTVEEIAGKGITGKNDREFWIAGNRTFLQEQGFAVDSMLENLEKDWDNRGNSLVWLGFNGKAILLTVLQDSPRPSAHAAIQAMKDAGIRLYLLSGDNISSVSKWAAEFGITNFQGELTPARKAEILTTLKRDHRMVAMAGDGINDSEALAVADVSIAMGTGTDVAMHVAGLTLVGSDLQKIPVAIKLSRFVSAIIRQNLFWAFIYNVIGIPVAAGILVPFTGFQINPMIAGAAMALSSVSVVLNSLRITRFKTL